MVVHTCDSHFFQSGIFCLYFRLLHAIKPLYSFHLCAYYNDYGLIYSSLVCFRNALIVIVNLNINWRFKDIFRFTKKVMAKITNGLCW